jgi:hypothetical protein
MTRAAAGLLFAAGMMGSMLQAFGADRPRENGTERPFEVTTTQRVPFLPGGTVRLDNSYGYLTVEGWDEPEVEITVTKATDRSFEPGQKEKAEKDIGLIGVTAERRSDKELAIETAVPVRNGFLNSVLPLRRIVGATPLPSNNKHGITVEYRVRVPRDSRLVVHHDNGYVWVSDVTGDIQVKSHSGDMIVMLSNPGPHLINATAGVGSVSSDFAGKSNSRFLLGTHFAYPSEGRSQRIDLRMGRGSITIKKSLPSGPYVENQGR